jgi:tetratricopeptide (TPR) repeat protein
MVHYRAHRWDQAIACFTEAIGLEPRLALAYLGRAYARLRAEDYDGALADFQQATDLDPTVADNKEFYYGRGVAYFKQGNLSSALPDLDRTLAMDPQDDKALFYRGNLYNHLGEFVKAQVDLDRAIELDAKNAESFNSRGFVHLAQHHFKEAVADFNRALALSPDYPEAFLGRGSARMLKSNYVPALADFDRAQALDPANSMVVMQRALCLEKLERFREAYEAYQEFLAHDRAKEHAELVELAHTRLAELVRFFN